VGFVDESGRIFLIDKKKEIIKYKGYQVCTSEIESVIETIEGVEMASVVGIPDQICTNLPAAVIVKRAEFDDLSEQFVIDYVAEKLPEYNQLHGGVYFVDELPMTPSGKIQKRFVKVIAIREYKSRMDEDNNFS
jgi:4-coumarate--CoA ligase